MNTKEYHEKVVGHLQTNYNDKVKRHYKVANKLNNEPSQKKMNTMKHHEKVVCKLNTKHSKKENDMNECHVKVIGQLHSNRLKQEMTMTSTHHLNQVNKLTSHMTLIKYQLVK